ncbi:MAG: NifB/NifX family molybdenum-iron cluster-binding protein [Sedimentisphaerales bacterium]|nr:NifB/NifX family molybdenum-iron cluster-binding protein [Sedimentisphaerales bacterium]
MKIAITATEPTLDGTIDPRFGRCAYFIIVDPETMEFQALPNANSALGSGAGIQSAQLITDNDAQTVLTGNCGPKAFATLNAAQIQVIVGVTGSVRQAAQDFAQGKLAPTNSPNVNSHFGMSDNN